MAEITRTSTLISPVPPTRVISPSCSTRRSLACMAARHVADLVEEERAAVRLLEAAAALRDRAGEGALLVAEQLALHELGGHRGAVHLHERLRRAAARGRGSRAPPAPCPCRSRRGSGSARRRGRRARPARAGRAMRRAVADEGQLVAPVALQLAVLALQAVEAQRVAQGEEQAVEARPASPRSRGRPGAWP